MSDGGRLSSRRLVETTAEIALAVGLSTALVAVVNRAAPAAGLSVVYLLAVLAVAVRRGGRAAVVAAIASVAAFNYFFVAPVHHLTIADGEDLAALGVFLIVAVVVGHLAGRAQAHAAEAERRAELAAELRRREAESRMRVLAAADEERRRVVRDLHDGAQQRLVHTVITLKLARRALSDGADAEPLVGEALWHAERATAELRELAHGILPTALTRGGLRDGVDALVSRVPLRVTTDVAAERFPPAIEATAYFVIAEALTNAVKYARAERAEVAVRRDGDALRIAVRDDGVGGAELDGGSGLVGLEDRVTSLAGTLRVDSPRGGGTLIEAVIPVGER